MKKILLAAFVAVLSLSSCEEKMEAQTNASCCENTECCKNCDDQECKETCQAVGAMSNEEINSEEGQALVQKCKTLCEKNGCCEDDKCEAHNKKDCCKK